MTRRVLAGGRVIDGTGAPGQVADVVVDGPVIAAIEPVRERHGRAEVYDVSGCVVAPGFVDVHSHADNAPLLASPDLSKVLQGVTTEVVGNCGMSLAPRSPRYGDALAAYLGRLFPPVSWTGSSVADLLAATDAAGYVVNYAPLIGHGTLRLAVMGFEARTPTHAEMEMMRGLVDEALEAGAVGLSTGLIYPPGSLAETAELVALSHQLRGRPALYASHIRGEGPTLVEAVQEAIDIGRATGVRVQISHHKATGRANWGKVRQTLAMIAQARFEGIDVRLDVYPYTASSTMLSVCLPPWLSNLADANLLAHLEQPEIVARVQEELRHDDWDNCVAGCGGFDGILIAGTGDHRFEGQTLAQVAADAGMDGAAALIHVLREERLQATMIAFEMDEGDVETVLRDPLASIGSDGLPPGTGGKPHPRQWGTFPRVLGRYVRERGVLSLEEAIHRMTGLPADTFRLPGVGRLAAGHWADLVVVEPSTVSDRASYTDPVQPPIGIRDVIIGGNDVVRAGHYTGARVGRRLRAEAATP